MEQKDSSKDRARYANMTREDRLREFKRTIAHPHLITMCQALHKAIQEPDGASLVFVCGPTGVGKTAMKNQVIRAVVTETLPALQEDRDRVPILSTLARPPLGGSFSWNDFLQSSLLALEQPLIDRKDAFDANDDEDNIVPTHSDEHRVQYRPLKGTSYNLRNALETAIRRRRPAAVIIDDAHHMGKVSGRGQLQNQLDCIRSLAEITETVHVLIGTYELLLLCNISAQLIRRSLILHFPRYGSTNEELSQFKGVLNTFQKLLPFEEETDVLLEHWDFCYERSLGCIGILHDMLVRALYAALWANEKTLSQKYLKQCALSKAECDAMMREINEGERELAFRSHL